METELQTVYAMPRALQKGQTQNEQLDKGVTQSQEFEKEVYAKQKTKQKSLTKGVYAEWRA